MELDFATFESMGLSRLIPDLSMAGWALPFCLSTAATRSPIAPVGAKERYLIPRFRTPCFTLLGSRGACLTCSTQLSFEAIATRDRVRSSLRADPRRRPAAG